MRTLTESTITSIINQMDPKMTSVEGFLMVIAQQGEEIISQNERIIDLLERIEVDTVELVRTLTNIAEEGL